MSRTERLGRRKALAKLADRIEAGAALDGGDPIEAAASLTARMVAILERRTPDSASRLARYANAVLQKSLDREWSRHAIECKAGCSYCCKTVVGATAPEIFSVARFIRTTSQDVPATIARIEAGAQATEGLDRTQRLARRLPCALLSEDLCSVYQVRPNVCRGFASLSLAACIAAHNGERVTIPQPPPLGWQRAIVDGALGAALIKFALPTRAYDLNGGVVRALRQEDAEQSWLAGADIFAGLPVWEVAADAGERTPQFSDELRLMLLAVSEGADPVAERSRLMGGR